MSDEKERERAGTWRLLAHEHGTPVEVEDQGSFDELVVDDWLHVERMHEAVWWLRVGDARLMVTLDAQRQPTVDIERGFYAAAKGATGVHES